MTPLDREALRTRLFLRATLPLLEVVMAERPAMRDRFRGVTATVQIEVLGTGEGAALSFRAGALTVDPTVHRSAEVRCSFRDRRAFNSFFAGKASLPSLTGFRHPLLLGKAALLLSSLRLLEPQEMPQKAEDRALRVKLLLYLATRALAELYRGGYPQMKELVDESPERVYQWTVAREGIGAYLRMARGRVKAGRGAYPHREPFIHFVFPDAVAALEVLTATGSQVDSVRQGRIRTLGSPEYTRKISLLLQKVDELLQEG